MGIFIILLIIIGAVILMAVGIYNGLIQMRNRCENAWAQVDVQLRRRYDEPRSLGPTCAMTVMTHFVTGILLSVGYLVDGLVLDGARIL